MFTKNYQKKFKYFIILECYKRGTNEIFRNSVSAGSKRE